MNLIITNRFEYNIYIIFLSLSQIINNLLIPSGLCVLIIIYNIRLIQEYIIYILTLYEIENNIVD